MSCTSYPWFNIEALCHWDQKHCPVNTALCFSTLRLTADLRGERPELTEVPKCLINFISFDLISDVFPCIYMRGLVARVTADVNRLLWYQSKSHFMTLAYATTISGFNWSVHGYHQLLTCYEDIIIIVHIQAFSWNWTFA